MTNDDEHKITRQIGQNLRTIRKSKGLSQETLARAAQVSFQQIQKYERGRNRISGVRFVQFSIVLEVPIMVFFDGIVGDGLGPKES